MPVVYFLNRLRPEANPGDYERWIREVDYPAARAMRTMVSYVVTRTATTLEGQPSPYDYVERAEVTDIDAYRQELDDPSDAEFSRQWASFVGESVAIWGEEIV
ncbi:MAG: hypothetical protein IT336_00595 [Thermomicrobiales bacterium]|nr:hypothetical protein [Thermomicrobiales bacterium]